MKRLVNLKCVWLPHHEPHTTYHAPRTTHSHTVSSPSHQLAVIDTSISAN